MDSFTGGIHCVHRFWVQTDTYALGVYRALFRGWGSVLLVKVWSVLVAHYSQLLISNSLIFNDTPICSLCSALGESGDRSKPRNRIPKVQTWCMYYVLVHFLFNCWLVVTPCSSHPTTTMWSRSMAETRQRILPSRPPRVINTCWQTLEPIHELSSRLLTTPTLIDQSMVSL